MNAIKKCALELRLPFEFNDLKIKIKKNITKSAHAGPVLVLLLFNAHSTVIYFEGRIKKIKQIECGDRWPDDVRFVRRTS